MLDLNNCIGINADLLSIHNEGPSSVTPGLVYTYTFSLERPADGLIIAPIVTETHNIIFDPPHLHFQNYSQSNLTIEMSVKSSVPDGNYLIQWKKTELNENGMEYLNILNQILNVRLDKSSLVKPTFDVEDFFYLYEGTDIVNSINFYLSQKPSESVIVLIESTDPAFITLKPSVIRFDRDH